MEAEGLWALGTERRGSAPEVSSQDEGLEQGAHLMKSFVGQGGVWGWNYMQ